MVEIAICLAVVGFALVAIIGVLPRGMDVQQRNREETIVNQDASVILESIRNGVRSGTDLTNYVFAITNYVTQYSPSMKVLKSYINGYTYNGSLIYNNPSTFALTNNARIIGLLSTPEYLYAGYPTNNLFYGGTSNHLFAYVRSLSGPAVEKPPQNNQLLIENTFSYRIFCGNAPVAMDTNLLSYSPAQQVYSQELAANLHELRLTFAWPLLPSGAVPQGQGAPTPMTQRTLIAGSIILTNDINQPLYFYQSQLFTNTP